MNNEIEEGEYIRTVEGTIARIEDSEFDLRYGCFGSVQPFYRYFKEGKQVIESIKTHSKNIIDLIEVGDIVEWRTEDNSYYGINEVIMRFGTIGVYAEEFDNCIQLNEITIKSIVTKEQYKSVEYVF